MKKQASCRAPLALAFLVALLAGAPASGQVCEPLQDGRLADVSYQETATVWQPVVEYERMVLTIAGPCEDIVKAFRRGEPISFDVGEIERVGDGSYTWELRREAAIAPATREQTGADGFFPQTWDLAGNEAFFRIRDTTNWTVPFHIGPGAPSRRFDRHDLDRLLSTSPRPYALQPAA